MRSRAAGVIRLALWLTLGFVVVLAVEAVIASRREYFMTPGYDVVGTARPPGEVEGPPVRLVMLGDSTVAGLGAETVADSLVLQTAERVADRLGRVVEARGFGVSGARTIDVRDEQIPMIDSDVDVVVIVIGSNDATHLAPPWRFDDLTRSMLAAAQQQAPDAQVVLGGIPLFGEARALNEPLRSVVDGYATVLRQVQRRATASVEGATYVNIATQASPRFVGVPNAMLRDGFHPGAVGYGFWADALSAAIDPR